MSSTLALALKITAINAASSALGKATSDVRTLAKSADEIKRKFADAWAETAKGAFALQYALPKFSGIVKPAADLEEAMLAVRSNLGSNTMAAAELNDKLKEVAKTSELIASKTRISKVGATNIQNELLKGGLAQGDIGGDRGAAMSVASLATLSGMDEGTAATNIVNIGSMFGLQKEQYGELADTLVRVDDAAATSIPKLVYGLQGAGFTARALGENAKSTAITLAMLSPLGEMAGTSLNRMLENTTGKTPKAQKAMIQLGLATEKAGKFSSKFYENGKFIGIARSLDMIREKLKAVKDDGQRIHLAEVIFGEEGGRAAQAALLAGKGYKEIAEAAEDSYSQMQKLDILMGGMNAQADRFKNSWQSLLAEVFDPLKGTLTGLLKQMADGANGLKKLAAENDTAKNVASIGAAAIGAGFLGYAGVKLGKGLKGALGGMADTAKGIAAGKAVEAATGVTPVFVTNWGDAKGTQGGALEKAGQAAEVAAATANSGGLIAKLKDLGKVALLFGSSNMSSILRGGSLALGTAGAGVLAAGAGGYAAGSYLNGFLSDDTKDKIGGMIATIQAQMGNQEAQRAIEINLHLDGQQITQVVNAANSRTANRH